MKKQCWVCGVFLACFVGIFCGIRYVGADPTETLSQMIRVEVDNVPVVDSRIRSKIIDAVNANLGKKISIEPRKYSKQSVFHLIAMAQEGKLGYSGSFGIGSSAEDIKKAWKITGEYTRRNLKNIFCADKSCSFIHPSTRGDVSEVVCYSFYGSPAFPSMSSLKRELGKPFLEYHFLDTLNEGKKKGINVLQRLHKKGIVRKGSNLMEAYRSGDFDLNLVVYKANRYFFYMMECRICNNSNIYRLIGVRLDANVFQNLWLV